MNNASGSPTDNKTSDPLIKQRTWRAAGVACIGGCAFMAWYGQGSFLSENTPLFLLGYWVLFLVLLLVAFYVVILDIRYIRMQLKMGERELFRETVDNEQFRKALREAKAEQNNSTSPPPSHKD